jgi:flagellar assembly protein FliH
MKMSTSCSPAPEAETKSARESRPFLYSEVAGEAGPGSSRKASALATGEGVAGSNEMLAQREAAAREAGRQEGQAQARAAGEERLGQIRESVSAALSDFARERARYYQQVESEVVQLALSIARKILLREAHIDPLLLAGLVRVTLEKIESATKVVARVNPQQAAQYREYFVRRMEPTRVPEVVEDATIPPDHCSLQTALGTTEMGVEGQLKEIEQGLFDLLAKRPANV